MNFFENSENRYETYWGGPLDQRAMQWAADHGLEFVSGGRGTTLEMGPGVFLSSSAINPDDDHDLDTVNAGMGLLRSENKKVDDEERARHAADPDLDTGTSGVIMNSNYKWIKPTCGEKLRDTKCWIELYEKSFTEAQERTQKLTSEVAANR